LCWQNNTVVQVCQIFLGKYYPNRKNVPNEHKMYQMVKKILNVCKIVQMAIKYFNLIPSRALQNLPKLGLLVWKETIWQPCCRDKSKEALYLNDRKRQQKWKRHNSISNDSKKENQIALHYYSRYRLHSLM
jgi:hypothetical protein